MTRARVSASMAAILTVLLLQATLVGPVTSPLPISLPAVLVAVVALVDGPATGMAFGFAVGLVADLGSPHPAGILALTWMGLGLLCGLVADRRRGRRDAVTAGLAAAVASSVATVLLVVVHAGDTLGSAVTQLPLTAVGDVVLALLLFWPVRRMLRTDSLRAPAPVYTDLAVGSSRTRASSGGGSRV